MTDNLLPPYIPAPVSFGVSSRQILQARVFGEESFRIKCLLEEDCRTMFAKGRKRVIVVFLDSKKVISLYITPKDTVSSVIERLEKRKKQNAMKDK